MAIYLWSGKEFALGLPIVTTRHMTVGELVADGNTIRARGTIDIRDHVEGIESEDEWVATGTLEEVPASLQEDPYRLPGPSTPTYVWDVQPAPTRFHFKTEKGEQLFTLLEEVNVAIRMFIGGKLRALVKYRDQNPGKPLELVEEIAQYTGPMYQYRGPCLCDIIRKSDAQRPFKWLLHTKGGQFPHDCFQCSCGACWYRGASREKGTWIPVTDSEAWSMLLAYNGVAVEHIVLDPRQETPQIVFLRTLRAAGLMPIC